MMERFRRATARRLRKKSTDAETKLWRYLREMPMLGSHMRRQVAIGPYFADFACMAARVVVEVDGSHHGDGEQLEYDQERTRWFESQGYRVIRFWNSDISDNIDAVIEVIYAAIHGRSDAEPSRLKHQRNRRAQPGTAQRSTPPPPASRD